LFYLSVRELHGQGITNKLQFPSFASRGGWFDCQIGLLIGVGVHLNLVNSIRNSLSSVSSVSLYLFLFGLREIFSCLRCISQFHLVLILRVRRTERVLLTLQFRYSRLKIIVKVLPHPSWHLKVFVHESIDLFLRSHRPLASTAHAMISILVSLLD
jgi:hypothetical protein